MRLSTDGYAPEMNEICEEQTQRILNRLLFRCENFINEGSFVSGIYRKRNIAQFSGFVNCKKVVCFPMEFDQRVGRTNVE